MIANVMVVVVRGTLGCLHQFQGTGWVLTHRSGRKGIKGESALAKMNSYLYSTSRLTFELSLSSVQKIPLPHPPVHSITHTQAKLSISLSLLHHPEMSLDAEHVPGSFSSLK